jgi:hypothetical protein
MRPPGQQFTQLPNFAAALTSLLENFVSELEGLGVEVPEARFIAEGITAWDGPSLAIYLGSIDQGQPGQPFGGTYVTGIPSVFTAHLFVQLLRTAPSLNGDGFAREMVPTFDELNEAGLAAMTDAASLVLAANYIHAKYLANPAGLGFAIGSCTPLVPAGGMAGSRLMISLSLA